MKVDYQVNHYWPLVIPLIEMIAYGDPELSYLSRLVMGKGRSDRPSWPSSRYPACLNRLYAPWAPRQLLSTALAQL